MGVENEILTALCKAEIFPNDFHNAFISMEMGRNDAI